MLSKYTVKNTLNFILKLLFTDRTEYIETFIDSGYFYISPGEN